MIAFLTAAGIVLLLLIILIIPIRAFIHFNADGGEIYIKILFFRFDLYPRTALEKKAKEEAQTDEKEKKKPKTDLRAVLSLIDDIKRCIKDLVSYFIRHAVKIDDLNISLHFGTGDPMYTGMLCGAVYPFVYNILSLLKRNKILKKYNTDIVPDFDEATLRAGIYARFTTRLFHLAVIISIVLRLVIKFLKLKRRTNKDEQFSKRDA
ncbi:MAG: DUF2953 domain-containing protein [Clostridiales bacterium]|nr:DUF2953 domain-containing protein [Clostridiales bacterium]